MGLFGELACLGEFHVRTRIIAVEHRDLRLRKQGDRVLLRAKFAERDRCERFLRGSRIAQLKLGARSEQLRFDHAALVGAAREDFPGVLCVAERIGMAAFGECELGEIGRSDRLLLGQLVIFGSA